MTYTYGPVLSWRYGRSLGIDITTPPKKCTFNCIYCQLGSTEKHVISPEDILNEIPKTDAIVSEVREILERIDQETVDVLTFSGTGEPTLNPNIGDIESSIRELANGIPIILLTNSSLLPRPDIRKRLRGFDIVTAKLDAGDKNTFKLINRPSKGSYDFDTICEGIIKLGKELKGILALEVMLLSDSKGLTNVEGASRKALIDSILDVNPDVVQIYTPWRPSAVSTIKPLSSKILQDFGNELSEHLNSEKVWIYGSHDARGKDVRWKTHQVLEQEMMNLLQRRPCRIIDITSSLGVMSSIVTGVLGHLQNEGSIVTKSIGQDIFYEATKK